MGTANSKKLSSALYAGAVMHHRFRPKSHRFVYRVFSLCLDLDELALIDRRCRLFNRNRFGLFAFYEKDHGLGSGQLRAEITQLLSDRGYATATARIELLCYPRILGYSFNPLSVYFCYNSQDKLELILYEVCNTFNQRHSYLLLNNQPDQAVVRQHAPKRMYVSPFMPMQMAYDFRIHPPGEHVSIGIRQRDSHQGAVLHATFSGNRLALNDANLLRLFVRYPLMTLKVIAAIHWEALRLWFKGVALEPRSNGHRYSVSWADAKGEMHYEVL